MLKFLLSLSGWDWCDIVGLALVFVGVVGEILIPLIKFKHRPTSEAKWAARSDAIDCLARMTAQCEAARGTWEGTVERWEHVAHAILVTGLALELAALPHHFKEAGELKDRAVILESTNLVLRSSVAGLELEVAALKNPRRITQAQRNQLSNMLLGTTNGAVSLACIGDDAEAADFASDIRFTLNGSFVNVSSGGTFLGAVPGTGIRLAVRDTNSMPKHTLRIFRAMRVLDANVHVEQMRGMPPEMVQIRVYPKR